MAWTPMSLRCCGRTAEVDRFVECDICMVFAGQERKGTETLEEDIWLALSWLFCSVKYPFIMGPDLAENPIIFYT